LLVFWNYFQKLETRALLYFGIKKTKINLQPKVISKSKNHPTLENRYMSKAIACLPWLCKNTQKKAQG
jgi:hypothetical protein